MTSISVYVAVSPAQKSRLERAVGDIQIKFCAADDPVDAEDVFGNPLPEQNSPKLIDRGWPASHPYLLHALFYFISIENELLFVQFF